MNIPIFKSFKEWSAQGYRIIKGSKATRRNSSGVPLFSEDQVKKVEYTDIGYQADEADIYATDYFDDWDNNGYFSF